MPRRLPTALWIAFFVTSLSAFFAWGGAALDPEAGPVVRQRAPSETFLAATYVYAGAPLVELSGLQGAAHAFATARFGPALAEAGTAPRLAMQRLLAGMDAPLRISHYGAPWLLLLALLASALRPRPIKTFGRR